MPKTDDPELEPEDAATGLEDAPPRLSDPAKVRFGDDDERSDAQRRADQAAGVDDEARKLQGIQEPKPPREPEQKPDTRTSSTKDVK